MSEKEIPTFECNMYAIGVNKGRAIATREILEAIDEFLKYDYPNPKDEFGKGVVWGLNRAKQIAKDWGGFADAETD